MGFVLQRLSVRGLWDIQVELKIEDQEEYSLEIGMGVVLAAAKLEP